MHLLHSLTLSALVLAGVVVSASSYSRPSSSSSGEEDSRSLGRHPLRHHGSPLDRLLNRLDSPSYYWRSPPGPVEETPGKGDHHFRDRDREGDNVIARDALRRAVEDYERGGNSGGRLRKPSTAPGDSVNEAGNKDEDEDISDELDIDSSDEDLEDDSDKLDEEDEIEDMMVDDTQDTSKNHMSEALSDSPSRYTSHSDDKWREYGTRERLDYNRRHPNPKFQMSTRLVTETTEHLRRMAREGACRVPRAQVIKVQDVYPDPSKHYMPHCTILHQCGDSSGCCRTETETCKPKPFTEQKVSLPFYTTRVGRSEPIVETLEFFNHTECECVRRVPEGRRHSQQLLDSPAAAARKQRQARNMQDMPRHIQLTPYHSPGCRCPSAYSPREMSKGCTCDCFDRETECLRFKRGKGYFTLEDRLCIQTEKCKLPECEFGSYMKLSGRCPKRDEKFSYHRRP